MKKSLLMLPALMMCAQANSQQLAFPGAKDSGPMPQAEEEEQWYT